MSKSKKPCGKEFEFALPQEMIEHQMENWVRGVLESNDELAKVLKRLRDSYCALLAGKPVKADDHILAQIEAVLLGAARAKNLV
jgi:hypothetical protein